MLKGAWIKMVHLEKSLQELRCSKIPLISYGAGGKESINEITFSNTVSFSVTDLMEHLGYNNIHSPSWQKSFLKDKPSHWNMEPWEKVIRILRIAGIFTKEIKYISRNRRTTKRAFHKIRTMRYMVAGTPGAT